MLFSNVLFVVADSEMNEQCKPEDYFSFLLNNFLFLKQDSLILNIICSEVNTLIVQSH